MRTPKFRAWNDALLRMEYDPEAQVYDFARVAVSLNGACAAWGKNLMQFTGLTDKKGREIYEGDVVRYLLKNPPQDETVSHGLGEAEWGDGAYCIKHITNPEPREVSFTHWRELEVIGNKFENPELLGTA